MIVNDLAIQARLSEYRRWPRGSRQRALLLSGVRSVVAQANPTATPEEVAEATRRLTKEG